MTFQVQFPWEIIRERFITTDAKLGEVGKEFGVSEASMKKMSSKQGWIADRQKFKKTGVVPALIEDEEEEIDISRSYPNRPILTNSSPPIDREPDGSFFDYLYVTCIERAKIIDQLLDRNLKRYLNEDTPLRPQDLVALGRMNFEIAKYLASAEAWIAKTEGKSIADMTDDEIEKNLASLVP